MLGTIEGAQVTARCWAPTDEIEEQARDQVRRIASLPWVAHVAVMPDVHFGIGATVGSVIAMRQAISPSAVGVDLGCGMAAVRTSLRADDLSGAALRSVFDEITKAVPVGFASHENGYPSFPGSGIDGAVSAHLNKMGDLRMQEAVRPQRVAQQVGTLGGGNHFIELCLDDSGSAWIMLHSGSRNVGKELAERHIARARALTHNASLEDRDLAVFLAGTPEMEAYRHDLYWAQEYARLNRLTMLALVKRVLRQRWPAVRFSDEPITCHHNYVAEEEHYGEQLFVTRKGAIAAEEGQLGIIPGSMGTRSYIVEGLGNPFSLNSASHGAGRRMSRGKARRGHTVADLEAQTAGVVCRKDEGVLDEIPAAYKPIEEVMANQRDLVRILYTLKGVVCIKG